jgi:hypothetical protein
MDDTAMPISQLFKGYEALKPSKRVTERGELLKELATGVGVSIPRVAFAVSHLKEIKDLYFLTSLCRQESKRGVPYGKVFWGSLKTAKSAS